MPGDLVEKERAQEVGIGDGGGREVQENLPVLAGRRGGLERQGAADALDREEHLRALGQGEKGLAALELAPARAA